MWQVHSRQAGKRKRQFYTSKREAEAEAATIRNQAAEAGEAWLALSASARGKLMQVQRDAELAGVDLAELLAAHRHAPPTDQAKAPALAEVIDELLTIKERSGLSRDYLTTLRAMLGQFASGREAVPVNQVTYVDVEAFLATKTLASHSTWRARLSTLFRFAVRRGYASENPCDRLEPVRYLKPAPRILSLAEVKACLAYFQEHPLGLAWFVLTAFAGLRPEEAQQMVWKDAQRGDRAIYVPREISKTRRDRLVHPIGQTLAWIKHAKAKGARLPFPDTSRKRLLKELRAVIGLDQWPKDVTRHTAASCWLAKTQNAAKVAEQLGNSEKVLKRDYKKPVPLKQARAFWALKPSRD